MKIKSYVTLRISKTTGEIEGLIEHSFSMGWSKERVRVDRTNESSVESFNSYWSKKQPFPKANSKAAVTLYYCHRSIRRHYKKQNPGYDVKIFRVGSKNCPIKIDWREVVFMHRKISQYSKFNMRNLPFKIKN